MDDYNRGLMASEAAKLTKRGPLLEQFMQSLSTLNGQAQTLEQRLAEMSDTERSMLLQTSKFVQMAMRMKIAASDYSMGYPELIQSMYGQMSITKRSLIAELLDKTSPLEFVPQAKPKRDPQQDALGLYQRPEFQVSPQAEPTQADDETASTLEAVLAEVFPEPTQAQSQRRQSTTYANKEEFLAAMTPVAKEVAADLGVSPRIVLAQAALETAWGSKVKGNNFFGIKSHGEDGGLDVVTHEILNGKKVKISDSFRQYNSPEDSVHSYGKFLKANSRYKHFLRAGAENENAALSALQQSGYATDPQYSYKLATIIKGLPKDDGADT